MGALGWGGSAFGQPCRSWWWLSVSLTKTVEESNMKVLLLFMVQVRASWMTTVALGPVGRQNVTGESKQWRKES